MKVPCYQCDTTTEVNVAFEVKNFVCPNCQSVYEYHNEGLRFRQKFTHPKLFDTLKIGQAGILRGKKYVVVGLIVKRAYNIYFWKEYTLQGEKGEYIYLSETSGHWILLERITDKYDVKYHPRVLSHKGMSLDLFDYSDVQIATAQGYFDFELPQGNIRMNEYINPPYILSIEKIGGSSEAYFGEHISKSEVEKAFPGTSLPFKSGVGLVQPFYVNVRQTVIIFCTVAILILFSHIFIYADQVKKEVMSETLLFSQNNSKELVSKSFELKGGSAPMTVNVSSDVDNSWANVQVALINESTGEERYASKDIEYYHGYTEGENWSEGSTNEEFNICGVPSGKYHITVTPQKAPEDLTNNQLRIKATWNDGSMRNIWMTILFMGILSVVLFYGKYYFEKQRWADSDNSPYSE
ncbi:DUF4178 domain-containing protein [Flavobacterium sp. SM15]|uniref:DUF4178 domain-containing protein n=1 Tax=Flavobacterium sp. SM15 TaxID=2908005 RepID=UPI001EDA881E|nr:DUF4178 domain-containing protein [Flavobacterium sp. SM15]MCG2610078.1 DUF4178 domain-containing protein [Flavobacterium sp. SM15]